VLLVLAVSVDGASRYGAVFAITVSDGFIAIAV
jgi:hypothetical protein